MVGEIEDCFATKQEKKRQLRESPSPKRVVGQLGGSKSTPMCIYKF